MVPCYTISIINLTYMFKCFSEQNVINYVSNTTTQQFFWFNNPIFLINCLIQTFIESSDFIHNFILHKCSAKTKITENMKRKSTLFSPFFSVSLDYTIETV